jgi:hypothetical protein
MVATKDSLDASALSVVVSVFSDWSVAVSDSCAFDDTITGSMCLLLQPPTCGRSLEVWLPGLPQAAWAAFADCT